MIPPLCIIQARLHSSRLPNKMLLDFGGVPLVIRGWNIACRAFGAHNVVVAIPKADEAGPLGDCLKQRTHIWGNPGPQIFAWNGPENDVLGRFYHCAHTYRWDPQSVIVRDTPDDPFKDVESLRRVAAGERLPVEQGGEAFTLAMLDAAYQRIGPSYIGEHCGVPGIREHLTDALFPFRLPAMPAGAGWSIDTPEDYEAAKARLARGA